MRPGCLEEVLDLYAAHSVLGEAEAASRKKPAARAKQEVERAATAMERPVIFPFLVFLVLAAAAAFLVL